MKTKDIACGGLMIASFLVLGLIFRTNTRAVQTYLEIIKTIIIAVFIRNTERNTWWIFAMACFFSCLIFVSIPDTLIYNVPSIVGGCVIGLQRNGDLKIRNYISYFIVNSVMLVYEFIMFGLLMQTNLFVVYREQFSDVLSIIVHGIVTETFLKIFFMLFIIFDSAFSSFVILVLAQLTLKKLNNAKRSINA